MPDSIAIITARSGSKGLPDKNIKLLCGKPLMAYSIEAALKSGCFNKVFVSTDSKKYAEIAVSCGAECSFLRSAETSGDSAGSWNVIKEVIERLELSGEHYDKIMLLQPTSPLRTAEDIKNSFALMEQKNARAVIGVVEPEHSPLWCGTIGDDLSMDNFWDNRYRNVPRQFLPVFYRINGAIYLITYDELYSENMFSKGAFAYVMPKERSIDIDSELDFIIAETLFNNNGGIQ